MNYTVVWKPEAERHLAINGRSDGFGRGSLDV
jgi:hypothetical protein